jgi:hypothetical protein
MGQRWGRSIKNGIIAAIIGGLVAQVIGAILVAVFGLPAFSKEWAVLPTVVGAGIVIFNAFTFLPLAAIFAALAGVWLTRRRSLPSAPDSAVVTVVVAILLLAAVSVPTTLALTLRGEEGKQQEERIQQERAAARADIINITGVSVTVAGESVIIQPSLAGTMPGQYRVQMTVADQVPLVTRASTLRLPENAADVRWVVPLAELRQAYRQKLLTGTQPALVEATFSVTVELELAAPDDASVNSALPPQNSGRSSKATSRIKLDLGAV